MQTWKRGMELFFYSIRGKQINAAHEGLMSKELLAHCPPSKKPSQEDVVVGHVERGMNYNWNKLCKNANDTEQKTEKSYARKLGSLKIQEK